MWWLHTQNSLDTLAISFTDLNLNVSFVIRQNYLELSNLLHTAFVFLYDFSKLISLSCNAVVPQNCHIWWWRCDRPLNSVLHKNQYNFDNQFCPKSFFSNLRWNFTYSSVILFFTDRWHLNYRVSSVCVHITVISLLEDMLGNPNSNLVAIYLGRICLCYPWTETAEQHQWPRFRDFSA